MSQQAEAGAQSVAAHTMFAEVGYTMDAAFVALMLVARIRFLTTQLTQQNHKCTTHNAVTPAQHTHTFAPGPERGGSRRAAHPDMQLGDRQLGSSPKRAGQAVAIAAPPTGEQETTLRIFPYVSGKGKNAHEGRRAGEARPSQRGIAWHYVCVPYQRP